jgi:signal transduction histidine kinase
MADPCGPLTPETIVALDRFAVLARLLPGILHDVNNSLLVISGTAEILDCDPPTPEALTEGLGRIRDRAVTAAAAVAEVLSFARGDLTGRGPVDLRQLAARALDFRAFSLRRAGVSSSVSAPTDVPCFVEGNSALLLQAVLGLLTNAEQALAGRTGGRIEVKVALEQDRLSLRVIDNGPGVARELHARAFESFVTTRAREESAGLGLAAASVIARAHGGTLTLDDTGSGASLALTLPRFDGRR